MFDIIIRDVEGCGFLGVVVLLSEKTESVELFRTGIFYKTEEEVLSQVKKQMANKQFMIDALEERKISKFSPVDVDVMNNAINKIKNA